VRRDFCWVRALRRDEIPGMGETRWGAKGVVLSMVLGLALGAVGCAPMSTTVAAGYPAVEGSGGNFDLIVDGTARTDSGGNGAYLVDDAVAAKRHYQISGTDTIVTVPTLTVGTYTLPPPNDNISVIYNKGAFYTAKTTLTINIVGNNGMYVWGDFNGMFSDAFASSTGQAEFAITGKFAAKMN
jgi:hypothetical protein